MLGSAQQRTGRSLEGTSVAGGARVVNDLPACGYSLARAMAIGGFWGPADAELVRHFFHDLVRVGYAFPAWVEGAEGRRLTSACAAVGTSGTAECRRNTKPVEEPIDFSLPSISLVGTCPA